MRLLPTKKATVCFGPYFLLKKVPVSLPDGYDNAVCVYRSLGLKQRINVLEKQVIAVEDILVMR